MEIEQNNSIIQSMFLQMDTVVKEDIITTSKKNSVLKFHWKDAMNMIIKMKYVQVVHMLMMNII